MKALYKTNFTDIPLLKTGKVRDVYDLNDYLLFVATDRISAFDVIMNEPVSNKGKVLTQISKYWFEKTKNIIANHLISTEVEDFPAICQKYKDILQNRAMLVKKTNPLPVECVVRGYIAGSGWKEYQNKGTICDIKLPKNLKEYGKLPSPIFTPSTKAEIGHDENINFDSVIKIIGEETANFIKNISIKLFEFASEHLLTKNIILADTKFEFGIDNFSPEIKKNENKIENSSSVTENFSSVTRNNKNKTENSFSEIKNSSSEIGKNNKIILIDEVLTPDSSRFWLKNDFEEGKIPYNFDKQVLRDYLESINWNKIAPAPSLPEEIITKTIDRYNFVLDKITN